MAKPKLACLINEEHVHGSRCQVVAEGNSHVVPATTSKSTFAQAGLVDA